MPAPSVTEQDIEKAIANVEYVVLPDGRTTLAHVTLTNGYTLRGESSCVSHENFNRALGEKYALADAKRKLWPLMGFLLAEWNSGQETWISAVHDPRLARYGEGLSFGDALGMLKSGMRVARACWNGKGMWLLIIPKSHWETTRGLEVLDGLPWIGMKTADNKFVPWLASQTDMLADDWIVLTDEAAQ